MRTAIWVPSGMHVEKQRDCSTKSAGSQDCGITFSLHHRRHLIVAFRFSHRFGFFFLVVLLWCVGHLVFVLVNSDDLKNHLVSGLHVWTNRLRQCRCFFLTLFIGSLIFLWRGFGRCGIRIGIVRTGITVGTWHKV